MNPGPKFGSRIGYLIVAVAAAIPFFLGKVFEFRQPDPYDSGMFVYSAEHILSGAKIGTDEIPSAQIGTLLVNLLGVRLGGFNEIGPKTIQGIFQAAALILMFLAMRRIFGMVPASMAVILASLYLSAPLIAKFGNVKEQSMIACMVAGVSLFLLYQSKGKRSLAVLAGACLAWAPLFKPTGLSAAIAVGLFLFVQPVLGTRSLKQIRTDLLRLLAGAAAAIAPLYVWILGWSVKLPLPYSFVWTPIVQGLSGIAASGSAVAYGYIANSRKAVAWAEQAGVVFRYYGLLVLPIAVALASIVARLLRLVASRKTTSTWAPRPYDRFVLLLAAWWLLDMAFVWISPRPYEQYYLPLNVSAAVLGGYALALGRDELLKLRRGRARLVAGTIAALVAVVAAAPVVIGTRKNPFNGADYGERRRGYVQKVRDISILREISARRLDGTLDPRFMVSWEDVGDYIRLRSRPTDKIYVWGWVPGIYVRARRFSSSPTACTSEMHVEPPAVLSEAVAGLLAAFRRNPPRFIVDTHNKHFPYDRRPPLELWPSAGNGVSLLDGPPQDRGARVALLLRTFNVRNEDLTAEGFLRPDRPEATGRFEAATDALLRAQVGPDEALRFAAMKPLRDYVMANFRLAAIFGAYVVFESVVPTAAPEMRPSRP